MADDVQDLITASGCFEYIQDKVFPLRPADYCKKYPKWPGQVGIEIEMLPLWKNSLESPKPRTVPLFGDASLAAYLQGMQAQHPDWRYNVLPEEPDHLLNIQLEDADQISFEPGGQLEFSTRPYPCLLEATERVHRVQSWLDQAADRAGIRILQIGMNPWLTVDEIGLQMTKPRYRAMDGYFTAQGPDGRRMMRQTCTIQVNLDFGDNEEILAKRYLASNLIAPFATATFANSPFLDGQATGLKTNRGAVWQKMDPTRTGFTKLDEVERLLNRRACVDAYLEKVMQGRVIFIEKLNYRVMTSQLTFRDWVSRGVEGIRPTLKDFQTHLSLMFPEVRARGFIELRSVDCQHRFWQDVPAAFYTGLLYDDQSLNSALDLLLPRRRELLDYWRSSLQGLADPRLAKLAQDLAQLAMEGFSRLPSCFQASGSLKTFQKFYSIFTERGLTPADAMLEISRQAEKPGLSVLALDKLAEIWARD